MEDQADVVAGEEFGRYGGVDDADVVGEGGFGGFDADRVELGADGAVATGGEGLEEGGEVGEGVPVAGD